MFGIAPSQLLPQKPMLLEIVDEDLSSRPASNPPQTRLENFIRAALVKGNFTTPVCCNGEIFDLHQAIL